MEADRIEQARQLRRDGATLREIAAAVGARSPRASWLLAAVADVPAGARTGRMRAKDELRAECVRLRLDGHTYDEIAAITGASKGSLSPWLRNIPHPAHLRQRLIDSRRAVGVRNARRAAERHAAIRNAAASEVQGTSGRDLFVAGLALYWAEGSKRKPWNRAVKVSLINSDPEVIRVWLAWLQLVGVGRERLTFRLSIHESADVDAALQWWAATVGVPAEGFHKTNLKRHNPRTLRRNDNAHYRGCLVVTVRSSTELLSQIEGWTAALVDGVLERDTR